MGKIVNKRYQIRDQKTKNSDLKPTKFQWCIYYKEDWVKPYFRHMEEAKKHCQK